MKKNAMLKDLEITPEKIISKITKLKENKSPGIDSIVPTILKRVANDISSPLCTIFRKSLDTGQVPDSWKCANVTAIFKKGSKDHPGNYRPVSLTSHVCKLLESNV